MDKIIQRRYVRTEVVLKKSILGSLCIEVSIERRPEKEYGKSLLRIISISPRETVLSEFKRRKIAIIIYIF